MGMVQTGFRRSTNPVGTVILLYYLEVRRDSVRASLSPQLSTCDLPRACDLVQIDAIDALSRNPLHEEVVTQRFGAAAR